MAAFPGKVGEHIIARLVSQFAKETEELAAKDVGKTVAKDATERASESVGKDLTEAVGKDYKATFFTAHPDLAGQVVVHHSVEQQVAKRYPGRITEAEMHSLPNLRGIPNDVNSELHLSNIRRAWNRFYKRYPQASAADLRRFRDIIDREWGSFFDPPV